MLKKLLKLPGETLSKKIWLFPIPPQYKEKAQSNKVIFSYSQKDVLDLWQIARLIKQR
jgi:hypothetical protein